MLTSSTILRKLAVKPDRIIDYVLLDHHARHRRRITLITAGGMDVLLDLQKATVLKNGDALQLDDGRLIEIKAAPEKLLEITANSQLRLMRLAWHIGNRHTPAELENDALYISYDHVLEEMVRGLGGKTQVVMRGFEPEGGAYEGHKDHGHSHG
jgi:urease accessory protein